MRAKGRRGNGRSAGCQKLVVGLTCSVAALFAPGVVAAASAADFNPGPGVYTADTSALTITGPSGVVATGQNVNGVGVFSFNNIGIPSGTTLVAVGSRPLQLSASGNFALSGLINGAGSSATNFDSFATPAPIPGGAGGGFGGTDGTQPGGGSGGGAVASSGNNGGGGGGFGGAGAPGGCQGGTCPSGQNAGAGGNAYGNLVALLQGGSGGGGGSTGSPVGGGGGGGAVAIVASSISIGASGEISVNGGDGAVGGNGASGGGSGGAILLRATTINVQGLLSAAGGQGGAGGCCGDGGGGGGGRIAFQYTTLVSGGTASVTGGTSGTASSPPGFTSGGASPVPVGASGVVTSTRSAFVGTAAASGISQTAATLNAFVNPNGNFTTYHFDFGTTTGYGGSVPGFEVAVGGDSVTHAVSQTVSGLAANTTYHYRIVATDSLGLISVGPDVAFTTPPPPPPPPPTASAAISTVGSNGTINVSCSGATGLTCAGSFGVTAHEHVCGSKITGVTAAVNRKKPKCTPKTTQVTVAGGRYSVAAGQTQSVHFGLNSTGLKLLKQFYAIPATMSFGASSGFAPAGRKLRFAYLRVTSTPDDFNLAVTGSSTKVRSWLITGIPSGGTVTVVCNGHGCSFQKRTFKNKHKVSILGGATLSTGDTVKITITAPNSVGMVDVVRIRSADCSQGVVLVLGAWCLALRRGASASPTAVVGWDVR